MKRPSALIPLAMSLGALGLVLGHIAIFGSARQADEGAAAHLWHFREPGPALLVLALQAIAGLAAAFPVFLLNL